MKEVKEGWFDGKWYSGCEQHQTWKIGCSTCETAMDRAADNLLTQVNSGVVILDLSIKNKIK